MALTIELRAPVPLVLQASPGQFKPLELPQCWTNGAYGRIYAEYRQGYITWTGSMRL
eukprot:SAG31_NODE_45100_length_260_cov_0.645963_1_plen_56_part_10